MAKKKASKKAKGAKKVASKVKRSARKTTRKSASTRRKARKPTRKVARSTTAGNKKKAVAGNAPVPFTINPDKCSIVPPSQHFPPSPIGMVIFNCTADCTITLSDPSVLGLQDAKLPLSQGSQSYPIAVQQGHCEFSIDGCPDQNGPGDIIVP